MSSCLMSVLEPNQGPVEDRQVLATTEPSFQLVLISQASLCWAFDFIACFSGRIFLSFFCLSFLSVPSDVLMTHCFNVSDWFILYFSHIGCWKLQRAAVSEWPGTSWAVCLQHQKSVNVCLSRQLFHLLQVLRKGF